MPDDSSKNGLVTGLTMEIVKVIFCNTTCDNNRSDGM